MTKPFIENESYKHKKAKEVLKEWFEETRNEFTEMRIGDIGFRTNRTSGIFLEYPICSNITTTEIDPAFYIIQEIMEKGNSFIDAIKLHHASKEWPTLISCDICQGDHDVICHCNTNPIYPTYEEFYNNTHFTHTYKTSWERNWDEIEGGWNEYVPTYDECVNKYNSYPVAIIDIVCSHKGMPSTAIEICHKNPVSQEKINKLKELGVHSLIEIDAEWILQQTKRPSELKYTKLI